MEQISRRLFYYYLNMDYLKIGMTAEANCSLQRIIDVVNGYISSCLNFILELFIIIFMSIILF